MEAKVLSIQGQEVRSVELNDDVFGLEPREGSIYYAVNAELANMRVGTASTKTRGEIRGSGAKPYSQKGTGRARAGHKRSPIWVGGGTVFGPKPRDYHQRIPRKMKRSAMKSVLSKQVKANQLKVVEDFTIESGKTRELVSLLKNLVSENQRTVMILGSDDRMIKRAGSNIPWLHFLSYNRLRCHDLYYAQQVLVLESGVKGLNEFYGSTE